MIENRFPRRGTVAAFDLTMRLGEGQMIHGETVIFDQRMLLQRRCIRATLLVQCRALVRRAFDEDGHDRGGDIPAKVLGSVVEKISIVLRGREKLHMLEPIEIHAEPARIF